MPSTKIIIFLPFFLLIFNPDLSGLMSKLASAVASMKKPNSDGTKKKETFCWDLTNNSRYPTCMAGTPTTTESRKHQQGIGNSGDENSVWDASEPTISIDTNNNRSACKFEKPAMQVRQGRQQHQNRRKHDSLATAGAPSTVGTS